MDTPTRDYDVCLSYATEDRTYVEQVAQALKAHHIRVFYDQFEEENLWGKNLYQHLYDVYRNRAYFCVIFISSAYSSKVWAKHELASAQDRALRENTEYVLPVRLDDTQLPGLNQSISYIDLRIKSASDLTRLIIKKVEAQPGRRGPSRLSAEWHGVAANAEGVSVSTSGKSVSARPAKTQQVSVNERSRQVALTWLCRAVDEEDPATAIRFFPGAEVAKIQKTSEDSIIGSESVTWRAKVGTYEVSIRIHMAAGYDFYQELFSVYSVKTYASPEESFFQSWYYAKSWLRRFSRIVESTNYSISAKIPFGFSDLRRLFKIVWIGDSAKLNITILDDEQEIYFSCFADEKSRFNKICSTFAKADASRT